MATSTAGPTPEPVVPVPSPPRRAIAGLFALAWLPRLAVALAYLGYPLGLDDMYQYDMLGLSLARGDGYRWYQREYVDLIRPYLDKYYLVDLSAETIPETGYPTTFRPPGYPAFLAAVYAVVGEPLRLPAVRLIQSALGASLAPLTLMLARRLRVAPGPALAAGALVALYPILWMYPVGLASENLFLPLTLVGLLLLLRTAESGRPGAALAAGLTLGAATLTRGALVVFVGFAALWLARRTGWRRSILFTAAAAALLVPWAVRNSLVLGRPAFVENSMGYTLFIGYHPEGNGGFVADIAVLPTRYLDESRRDAWTLEQAVGFIREDAGLALSRIPRRLAYLAGFETRELLFFYSNGFFGPLPLGLLLVALLALVVPWAAIALTAGFGLARAEFRAGRDLILLFVLAPVVAYLPILAEPRFHLPLVPPLAAYSAAALSAPASFLRPGSRARRPAFVVAGLAALALIALWAWDPGGVWDSIASVLQPGGHQLRLPY